MSKKRKNIRKKRRVQLSPKKLKQMLIFMTAIIVPAFILWGIGTAIQSNKYHFIGKIGSWTITRPLWNRTLRHSQILELLMNPQSQDISHDELKELTWERLKLMYLARKNGIKISDKELFEYLKEIPVFKNKDGKFSLENYAFVLSRLNIPKKEFEEAMREQLSIIRLKEKITSGIEISDEEVIQSWQKEQESFQIKYKLFSSKDFQKDVKINDNEIEEYYKTHKNELIVPKKVKLEYIILPNNEDLSPNKAYSLEELAQKYGSEIKETGFISKQDIVADFGFNEELYQYAFSLNKGQTSPLLKVGEKYYLIKVEDVAEKHIASFEEAKDKIRNELIDAKAKEMAFEKAKEMLIQKDSIDWDKEIKDLSAKIYYIPQLGKAEDLISFIKTNCLEKDNTDKHNICGPYETPAGYAIISLEKYNPAPQLTKKQKEKIKRELLEEKKDMEFLKYIDKEFSTIKVKKKKSK